MQTRSRTAMRTASRIVVLALAAAAAAACGFDALGERRLEPVPVDGGADASLPDSAPPPPADGGADVDARPCEASPCVVDLALDSTHACVAIAGEPPRCWGDDSAGQLGRGPIDGGGDASPLPARVALAAADFVETGGALTADHPFSCALVAGGTPLCWGSDDLGQRGRGEDASVVSASTPAPVALPTGMQQLAAGGSHACTLDAAGVVRCWGYGERNQLAHVPPSGSFDPTPKAVTLPRVAKQIATGGYHSCALLDDATVACWGFHNVGQLGRLPSGGVVTGEGVGLVSGVSNAAFVALGWGHSCVVGNDGGLACFGLDSNGQLGRGVFVGFSAVASPVTLPAGRRAVDACAGTSHTCALLDDGTVSCWGENDKGQLGFGSVASGLVTPPRTNAPTELATGVAGASKVRCGGSHTCALLRSGEVTCWGANDAAQLGRGAPDAVPHPLAARVLF